MKKFFFIVIAIGLSSLVHSQEDVVIQGTKKVSKDMTPKQVTDSLHKRFPDAQAIEYYKVPKGGVDNGWTVTKDDNIPGSGDVEYYTISFKRGTLKYYGLYKPDGTLVESKVEETSAHLPDPVKNSLKTVSSAYPGYTVISKSYYKQTNLEKSKEYYEIVAQKGNSKKTLYYTPDGTLVKVK
jgi:hypothetical protein